MLSMEMEMNKQLNHHPLTRSQGLTEVKLLSLGKAGRLTSSPPRSTHF